MPTMILKLPPEVSLKFKDLGNGHAYIYYIETYGKKLPQKYLKNTYNIMKALEKIAPKLKVYMDVKCGAIWVKGLVEVNLAREFLGSEFIAWTKMAGMTIRDLIGTAAIVYATAINAKDGEGPPKLIYEKPIKSVKLRPTKVCQIHPAQSNPCQICFPLREIV